MNVATAVFQVFVFFLAGLMQKNDEAETIAIFLILQLTDRKGLLICFCLFGKGDFLLIRSMVDHH